MKQGNKINNLIKSEIERLFDLCKKSEGVIMFNDTEGDFFGVVKNYKTAKSSFKYGIVVDGHEEFSSIRHEPVILEYPNTHYYVGYFDPLILKMTRLNQSDIKYFSSIKTYE